MEDDRIYSWRLEGMYCFDLDDTKGPRLLGRVVSISRDGLLVKVKIDGENGKFTGWFTADGRLGFSEDEEATAAHIHLARVDALSDEERESAEEDYRINGPLRRALWNETDIVWKEEHCQFDVLQEIAFEGFPNYKEEPPCKRRLIGYSVVGRAPVQRYQRRFWQVGGDDGIAVVPSSIRVGKLSERYEGAG